MPPFTRAITIVLDGVGIGALPDAAAYGDAGCHTLGHVAERVHLSVPTLRSLGLGRLVRLDDGTLPFPKGAVGRLAEASPGKDSVTGHWELMGVVLDRPFPVFPHGFPDDAIDRLARATGRSIIGNRTISGTAVIEVLGPEHLRTGALIVYTSADSVCQIAAHEGVVPRDELYRACEAAFTIVCRRLGVGRVIARPFTGSPGSFARTPGRRDFVLPPPGPTFFDRCRAAGRRVVAIGKIDDLFGGRGLDHALHTVSDEDGMHHVLREVEILPDGGVLVANLVDFDTVFGHRNDTSGFAANLERFDAQLAALLPRLREGDLLAVTADHGNDPTTPGTDHTREYVPLFLAGPRVRRAVDLGTRPTFADLACTLAEAIGVPPPEHGSSFLKEIVTS